MVKKKESNVLRGKKSRAAGKRFELKVRQRLEEMDWIVARWTNTVEYEKDGKIPKLVPAKPKFRFDPKIRRMIVAGIGNGFPDFVAFKKVENFTDADGVEHDIGYEVIGLEVKANGYLDQKEKSMCHWLLDNKVFSRILIAKKGKERGKIDYIDFKEKYKKDFNSK